MLYVIIRNGNSYAIFEYLIMTKQKNSSESGYQNSFVSKTDDFELEIIKSQEGFHLDARRSLVLTRGRLVLISYSQWE